MTREEFRQYASTLRLNAQGYVRSYARRCCETVSAADVDAIVNALGDISIDEACDALDRFSTSTREEKD
jgi:hypothetical protein